MSLNTTKKNSKNSRNSNYNNKQCKYCNKKGHFEDHCFKKYPHLNSKKQVNNTIIEDIEETCLNTTIVDSNRQLERTIDILDFNNSNELEIAIIFLTELLNKLVLSSNKRTSNIREVSNYNSIQEYCIKEESVNTTEIIVNTCKESIIKDYNLEVVNWVLDSGASTHICYIEELFNNIKPINNTIIKQGNTSRVIKAKGIGDITITFTSTNRTINLKNVLFIPQLGVNLLSLYNILNRDYSFNFSLKEGLIYDNQKELIAKGYYFNKLATFATTKSKANITINNIEVINSTSIDTITLHRRLGHIGYNALSKVNSNCLGIDNISINNRLIEDCIICLKAKFTKKVSKKPISTIVNNYGDLIYIDLGGPISPTTLRGYKYYITFLDYNSKYLDLDILKSRENLITSISTFYNKVANIDKVKIKEFQGDNEFNTDSINKFNKEKGINFRPTAPYSPEQKGGVERINRTLLNKIRALLF